MQNNDILLHSQLRDFLNEICAGDEEIFLELLGDCETDLRDQYSIMEESIRSGEWKAVNRAAHTIKSTARTFGSPPIRDLSRKLEKMSEADPPESVEALEAGKKELDELIGQFTQKLREIRENPRAFFENK